jgi:hypothetical protein
MTFQINSQLNSEKLMGRFSSLGYKMLSNEQIDGSVFLAKEGDFYQTAWRHDPQTQPYIPEISDDCEC